MLHVERINKMFIINVFLSFSAKIKNFARNCWTASLFSEELPGPLTNLNTAEDPSFFTGFQLWLSGVPWLLSCSTAFLILFYLLMFV